MKPACVRDWLSEGWVVIAGDAHEILEEDGARYVVFDKAVSDDTLTYLLEAPSGPAATGEYMFGSVEYEISDGEGVTATGTEEFNTVVGPGTDS